MSELDKFRMQKDEFFAGSDHSPLTIEQKENFRGLDYFAESDDLRLEVQVDKFEETQEIIMQTSTGDTQTFQRYGRFHFQVNGEDVELTIYFNQHGYFLPYVDSQAGVETYPAGRYLDPESLPDGKFLIDFNLAYNPYCAYNDQWSCPFPPAENRLAVPIRAGEKLFKTHE